MSEQKLYTPSGEPEFTGNWGETPWELHLTNELPDNLPITAVGCVAVCGKGAKQTLLTQNMGDDPDRNGKWEIPCGKRDLVQREGHPDKMESWYRTARREGLEEVGASFKELYPFAIRKIFNPVASERPERFRDVPSVTCMLYVWSTVKGLPDVPTDPKHRITGTFSIPELRRERERNLIDADEYKIVWHGMLAAQRSLRRA